MTWQDILTILLPLLGLMAWVYNRIEKKADERQANLEKRLDKFESSVRQEFKEVHGAVSEVRDRLTRLEGRFDERGYWESRQRTGTEGQ